MAPEPGRAEGCGWQLSLARPNGLEGQDGAAPLMRAGEAWADPALLERLGLKVGDQVWGG